jgi:putative transposase
MLKAYEFRIFPTKEQEQFLLKTSGLCRLYWNTSLARKREAFENDEKWNIGSAKKVFEECRPEAVEWCNEVDSSALAAEWGDIASAFNNFFKSCKGQRKLRVNAPRFKSKKTSQIAVTWTSMAKPKILKNGYLFLTRKLGPVKGTFHRWAEGDFKHATVKQTPTGKWFVKICIEKKKEPKNQNGKSVGIDWNCRDEAFIVMSNGTKIKCPRFLQRASKQLRHQQKILSKRFVKGLETQSSNYYRQKQKVALLHERVANQRKDWLHKLSRQICNEYETVVVEDIDLQTMAKMSHGKVVGDQGFGMLRQMIAYKGNLVKANPRNTSKTCHCCGYVNPDVKVGVEYWECPNCHAGHDRDINAALNILFKYNSSLGIVGRERAESINACGGPSSPMKQEVSNPSNQNIGL